MTKAGPEKCNIFLLWRQYVTLPLTSLFFFKCKSLSISLIDPDSSSDGQDRHVHVISFPIFCPHALFSFPEDLLLRTWAACIGIEATLLHLSNTSGAAGTEAHFPMSIQRVVTLFISGLLSYTHPLAHFSKPTGQRFSFLKWTDGQLFLPFRREHHQEVTWIWIEEEILRVL